MIQIKKKKKSHRHQLKKKISHKLQKSDKNFTWTIYFTSLMLRNSSFKYTVADFLNISYTLFFKEIKSKLNIYMSLNCILHEYVSM